MTARPKTVTADELLTIPEACQRLRLKKSWIYRNIRQFDVVMLGNKHGARIVGSSIDRFLARQLVRAETNAPLRMREPGRPRGVRQLGRQQRRERGAA